jgi:hypothetical protein
VSTRSQTEAAETLALEALAYLAASETDLQHFIDNSGLGADELRTRAGEPAVLRAVLDFLLSGDERLLAFCRAQCLTPKDVHMARHALDGEK